MAKVREKKTTKTRAELKKPAVKVQAKSKLSAPKKAKAQRKRAVVSRKGKGPVQAPTAALKKAERPVAVVAPTGRSKHEFPVLWPALGLMRMWLGPRKSSHT